MTTRILIVANWLHDVGGVQTATGTLRDAFVGRGMTVEIASVLPPHTARYRRTRVRTLYPASRLRRFLERNAVTTRVARLDAFGRLVALARMRRLARGADAVIAMDVFAAELAVRAVSSATPVFAQFHNTATALDGTRDLARLLRIGRRLAALVALTPTDATHFTELGFDRVETIPNVVAPVATLSVARERLVVGVGRYTTVKRFDLLVRAWSKVPAAVVHGWRLELHGDGPERAALEMAARGIDSVRVEAPSPDVPALLSRAALLALPYAVSCAQFWNVTDDAAESANRGWKRFLWLNFVTGFAVTMLLIWWAVLAQ